MRPYARQSGTPPARALRAATLAALVGLGGLGLAGGSWAGTLAVTVLLPDGHPLTGVIVTARPSAGPAHPAAAVAAAMDQVNRTFAPDLLVIPVGSTVAFPNSDSVSHQIYSFSPAKRFQLPLYRGKPYPPVVFDQPGLVTLGCNIHDEMLAYVVVTDAPLFGPTNKQGSWSAQAPGGTYHISIWHPRIRDDAKSLESEVTVSDPGGATLTFHLTKLLKPAPLEGRPHSWDSY
jgi:plastocyanin